MRIFITRACNKGRQCMPWKNVVALCFTGFLSLSSTAQPTATLPPDYGRTHIASCIVGPSNFDYFRHYTLQADGRIQSFRPAGAPEVVQGIDKVAAIAGGSLHILVLKQDGTVWAWGDNSNSQLGSRELTKKYTYISMSPVQVDHLSDIIAISATNSGCFALKKDGTVWAWGTGCGLADKRDRLQYATPQQVPGINNAIAISGPMALLADGTVVAWGGGIYGRLGNGTKTGSDVPVKVKGLSNVVQLAAADDHALALLKDGTVWAWGSNLKGYLGNGVTGTVQGDCSTVPVQVKGLSNVVAIDCDAICLALTKEGTLKAWGWGPTGGMGFRSDEINATPRPVPGITKPVAFKAGNGSGFAVLADGSLIGWGAEMTTNKFHGVTYKAIKVGTVALP